MAHSLRAEDNHQQDRCPLPADSRHPVPRKLEVAARQEPRAVRNPVVRMARRSPDSLGELRTAQVAQLDPAGMPLVALHQRPDSRLVDSRLDCLDLVEERRLSCTRTYPNSLPTSTASAWRAKVAALVTLFGCEWLKTLLFMVGRFGAYRGGHAKLSGQHHGETMAPRRAAPANGQHKEASFDNCPVRHGRDNVERFQHDSSHRRTNDMHPVTANAFARLTDATHRRMIRSWRD